MDEPDIYQSNKHKKAGPTPTPKEAAAIKLTTFIFLITGSIILAVNNELWGLAIVIPIIVLGNQFFKLSRPSKRLKTSIILIFADAAVIGIMYFLRVTFTDIFDQMKICFPMVLFGSIIFTFGAWAEMTIIGSRIVSKSRCKIPVVAYCTEIHKQKHYRRGNKHSHVYYSYHPVYKFTFEGTEYESWGMALRKGEESPLHQYYELLVDPEEPEAADDQRDNTAAVIGYTFLGIIFIAGGIALIVLGCTLGLIVINDPETAAQRTYHRY